MSRCVHLCARPGCWTCTALSLQPNYSGYGPLPCFLLLILDSLPAQLVMDSALWYSHAAILALECRGSCVWGEIGTPSGSVPSQLFRSKSPLFASLRSTPPICEDIAFPAPGCLRSLTFILSLRSKHREGLQTLMTTALSLQPQPLWKAVTCKLEFGDED